MERNRDVCNYFQKVLESPLAGYINRLKACWDNLNPGKSAESLHHKDNRAEKCNVVIKTNMIAIQTSQWNISIYTTIAYKDDYKVFFCRLYAVSYFGKRLHSRDWLTSECASQVYHFYI